MTQPDERPLNNDAADGPSDDPVEQLRARTRRAQILRAAAEAFAEHGFHRAKTRDVAERAGVAEGTIYNYFGGKDDLLLALLDAVNETDAREDAFAAAEESTLDEFVREYVGHRLGALEPHLDVLRPILSELLVDVALRERYRSETLEPTLALAERYVANRRTAGDVADLDPGLLARAMAGQVLGLALLRMLGDERLERDWEQLVELLPTLLLGGLRPGGGA